MACGFQIQVFSVQRVNKSFSAREFARQRTYTYHLPAAVLMRGAQGKLVANKSCSPLNIACLRKWHLRQLATLTQCCCRKFPGGHAAFESLSAAFLSQSAFPQFHAAQQVVLESPAARVALCQLVSISTLSAVTLAGALT